ncbi:MAG: MFS transporter, partial [Anaerolineales bacterium]
MPTRLSVLLYRLELLLTGPIPAVVRRSMYVDVRGAIAYSLFFAIFSFIPIILRRLGASVPQLAYYYAISAIGALATGVGIWLMRRFGMARVAIFGWLVGRGALVLTALAANVPALLAIITVFWVLDSWASPAYIQAIQHLYPARQRARVVAMTRLWMVGGILLVAALAGWVLDHWGFRAMLPLAGVSAVASALIFRPLLAAVPDIPPASSPTATSPGHMLRADGRLRLYLAGSLLFGLSIVISNPIYPAIQVDRLNLSYTAVGLLGLVQSGFWFITYLFIGRLADRFGDKLILVAVALINALVMLPYIWASSAWMLVPAFIAAGIVAAGADLAGLTVLIDIAGPDRAPDYAALNATLAGARGLAGPFIGSFLIQLGWPLWTVLALSTGLSLAGAGVLMLL